MTELRANAPVKRETSIVYRGRPLMIAAHPGYIEIRQKGKRCSYVVSWDAVYDLGAKLAAAAARAEKLARKKGKS